MVLLLASLVCLILCADALNNTRCFICTDIQHPSNCTTVTECAAGQACIVEQFITSGGLVQYNSGCRSTQLCGSKRRRRGVSQYSSLSRRSDVITCDQCCDGDFCNNAGCGDAGLKQPERGALCFQCHAEDRPDTCRHLRTCNHGELCMLTELPTTAPTGGNLYKTACVSPPVCQAYTIIGRRRNTYCHMCCSDDFCNDHCDVNMTSSAITTSLPTDTTRTSIIPTHFTPSTALPTHSTPTSFMPTDSTSTSSTPLVVPTKPPATMMTSSTLMTSSTVRISTPTTFQTTSHSSLAELCHHRHYNYDASSNLCYKLHYEHKSWNDANKVCKHEGGTLAIINTQAKWDVLKQAMQHDARYSHQAGVHIGGKQSGTSHVFTWVDGTSVVFANWASGEPDSQHSDCIYLSRSEDYKWHDRSCNNNHLFVCSIQM